MPWKPPSSSRVIVTAGVADLRRRALAQPHVAFLRADAVARVDEVVAGRQAADPEVTAAVGDLLREGRAVVHRTGMSPVLTLRFALTVALATGSPVVSTTVPEIAPSTSSAILRSRF